MTQLKVLIVAKYATLDRLAPRDLDRLLAAKVNGRERLLDARDQHENAIQHCALVLSDHQVRIRRSDQIYIADTDWADLVVAVGGDGTVFSVHKYLNETPVLAVNSDPSRSVGHFTRINADGFRDLFTAWRSGKAQQQSMPRLGASIDGRPRERILNDCLFTSSNPAAMTRYRISVPEGNEMQSSSGVWIATAAGSTGAIGSAGICPLTDPLNRALLYRVREPFMPRRQYGHLEGCQKPPVGIKLTAGMPGVRLYIDGTHASHDVHAGESVEFDAEVPPLTMIAPA